MADAQAVRRPAHAGLSLVADERSVTLAGTDAAARFAFRGDGDAVAMVGRAFGVALPMEPWRSAVGDKRAALWLGPDEWLLLDEGADPVDVSREIRAAIGDCPCSWVDVSHRNAGFVLSGPHAADVLSAGCPLPLGLAAFPVGRCTRTLFGKAEIVLWRTGETAFRIEVWRSYAAYVAALIAETAREHTASGV